MQGIDLHTHSHISDGTLSPAQLVQAAIDASIQQLALTDHDSMHGIALARQAAQGQAIQIIQGVEISSQWSRASTQKSFGVHIVALDMQNLEPIQTLLHHQQQLRAERAIQICEKLQRCTGIDVLPHVLSQVDEQMDRVTRTHIAKALVALNVVTRAQQAFDRFLKQGKPAFVKFDGPQLADCIATIHAAQGFAVLAHPTRYDLSATNIRQLVGLFAESGGDAIELPSANEPPATRHMIDRLIAQHELKVSIGSDFHGDNLPWVKLGNTPKVNTDQVGIWESFRI